MPHCVIEYSEDIAEYLDPQDLVLAAHQALDDSELFDAQTVRTRARPYHAYHAGEYHSKSLAFIHLTLRIMPGLTDLQKEDLTIDLIEIVQLFQLKRVLISCEIIEMSDLSYSRLYVG